MARQSQVRRILHAVIGLEVSKGHLRWKISDLARKVRVSRPLIYYHFGKTKQEILERSAVMVAEDFFGITPERIALLEEGRAVESLLQSRKLFLADPSFALFYLKWRTTSSPLQRRMIEIEERYQAMLQEHFPRLKKAEVVALHAMFYSVVTAPFLEEKSIKALLGLVPRG